jgi:hypothetical protein
MFNTTFAADALERYKAGDYADSEWTYVRSSFLLHRAPHPLMAAAAAIVRCADVSLIPPMLDDLFQINEATVYASLADINADHTAYAAAATAALSTNVANMVEWNNLPTTVATGLKAQYEIQNGWLETDVGQVSRSTSPRTGNFLPLPASRSSSSLVVCLVSAARNHPQHACRSDSGRHPMRPPFVIRF